ncbi:MAG: ATP-dependent protease ATPase subunit HslU [Chloroflexota bacterium]|nr:ATP-dependent protease ATPase subunit HslU [Chloroflexota bacterium]MDQ5866272.1 ATP-dependent protease ATPase subunit HslU [Chloroflexota bacterium]
MQDLTPRQIVVELDKYIVGQAAAKRAIAIALRNRVRRQKVDPIMRDEITPKNLMLIGPTGVGKTEIARRVARLIDAPFIKVEATKFTEVGYVGRDVESIVRDLAEAAFSLEHDQRIAAVRDQAESVATERLINLLMEQRDDLRAKPARKSRTRVQAQAQAQVGGPDVTMPATMDSGSLAPTITTTVDSEIRVMSEVTERALKTQRRKVARMLAEHKLDEEQIEIDVNDLGLDDELGGVLEFSPGMSPEEMSESFSDFLDGYRSMQSSLNGLSRKRVRRMSVREARRFLVEEEAHKLVDMDSIVESAMRRAEQNGVVFIDEIDKITGSSIDTGPDVSGEGVQRDMLPIVEGSTVQTRYGPLKTDHVLFIAAGAFHGSKPSDLIPELQGRFPLRVELESLGESQLQAILTEPENALTRQYTALMKTEGVDLEFSEDGTARIAEVAAELNGRVEDIGARRLHTIMEQVLEDLAFRADEEQGNTVTIDAAYVDGRVKQIAKDDDLSRFIL